MLLNQVAGLLGLLAPSPAPPGPAPPPDVPLCVVDEGPAAVEPAAGLDVVAMLDVVVVFLALASAALCEVAGDAPPL